MTQDEIIDIAVQAGMAKEIAEVNIDIVEAFAKLVEEKVNNDARAYLLKMHDDWLGEGTRGQA